MQTDRWITPTRVFNARIRDAYLRSRGAWRIWSWTVLAVIFLLAFVVTMHYGIGTLSQRVVDALRVLPHFPGYDHQRSWPYNLGRQLGALALLLATIGVVATLLSHRLAEMRARLRRRHVVVCGLGDTGIRSVRAFRASGQRVTCLERAARGDAIEDARARGAIVLHRDATQTSALESARADHARTVVCACADDATNSAIAAAVVGLAHRRKSGVTHGLSIHVHIDNANLAHVLRAPLASVGSIRLHFFNTANVWARALLDDAHGPFANLEVRAPRIVVFGTTDLGRALAVEAARRWHQHASALAVDARARITVVASDGAQTLSELERRYPSILKACDLAAAPVPSAPDALGFGTSEAQDAIYACLDDHSANLALALELGNAADETPVFLPAVDAAAAFGPLLISGGQIRAVPLSEDDRSLDLIHDDMTEALARAAHDQYLENRRYAGDFGARPADRAWEALTDLLRDANRAHVASIVEQLRAVWYRVEPMQDWDASLVVLPADAVEAMAELEHARWLRERRAAGYRFAPARRDSRWPWRRRHDLLVGWSELPSEAREIDRVLVRERPAILRRAGFGLARDPARERVARTLHERYVAHRAAGEPASLAVPWDRLPEEARESNRGAADHIAVKLARIGCRITPSVLVSSADFVIEGRDLEEMAKLEHERWVDEKLRAGWRNGPRYDEERTHPSIVPWSDLSESEREKDREQVRAIPAVLESVGYAVTRDTG